MLRALALLPAVPALLLTTAADASWSASGAGSAAIAADTVDNATGFAAVCAARRANSAVTLSWTATPDAYVEGYQIVRSAAGGGTAATFLVPRTTTTMTDSPPTGAGIAYSYTIQARSTAHAWVSAVTPATGTPTYSRSSCTTA